MLIQDLIAAVVARLKGRLTTLHVEDFPDDPEAYNLFHPAGAALVGYGGSVYGRPESLDLLVQERRVEIDVTLVVRKLHGATGAHAAMDAIRVALTGFRIAGGGTKLEPVQDRFISHSSGIWRYAITFATRIPAIEVVEGEQLPLLARITLASDAGQSDVTKP